MAWPPSIEDVLNDMKKDDPALTVSAADRQRLTTVINAAVAFVERIRRGDFNFDGDLGSALPEPSADVVLGTIRLAGRWHIRRRSPDALVEMGEQGSSRIPSFDPDIERLLRIGRHVKPSFG
jgi:hypothetical protein